MPSIPIINNPVTGKSYTSGTPGNRTSDSGGEELFDLIQLENPLEVQDTAERNTGGRGKMLTAQKDFLSMSVKIAKDPTMAVESLKQLINDELLGVAKNNGYTELYGELDSLMKGLYLNTNTVVPDIISQEKQNTIFSGDPFFDMLRELAGGGGTDLKNAIGNLLKAINFAQNKTEIFNAIASNLKFLSGYFAPNKGLSENLGTLSQSWKMPNAGINFETLKNQTLFQLQNVSESLLNNEQTQILLPLIVHNLSRYNTNTGMLPDYFSHLLAQVPNEAMKNKLTAGFENFIKSLLSGSNGADNMTAEDALSNNTTNLPINQAPRELLTYENQIPEYLGIRLADTRYTAELELIPDELNAPVRSYLLGKTEGMLAIKDTLNQLIREPYMQNVLARELGQIVTIDGLVNYLNDILGKLPDIEERQIIYENLVEIINNMAENEELPSSSVLEAGQNRRGANHVDNTQFNFRDNLDASKLYGNEKQSTLNGLIDFVDKNIDHAALKSINNYNASNLLQSLINAPGVFTPLAHYIIPIQVEDTRAFGELWVDNDEDNASAAVSGEKRKYHLFLTFDIGEVGRFEVDMYCIGEDVNISLMHPESFSERIDPLVRRVNRIIAGSGYTPKNFRTAPLAAPHTLTQIFPHLDEKRGGFNVKA